MRTPDLQDPASEYYQMAQYTCVFNARDGQITCKPFVRTFLKSGKAMTEVTPVVNRGGRLPVTSELRNESLAGAHVLDLSDRPVSPAPADWHGDLGSPSKTGSETGLQKR
ncbi:hypothetical protein JCM10212_004018 [Sporobolomyces blumeae]